MSEATRDGLMEELDQALETAPQAWEMQPEAIDTHELMRDRSKRRAFLQRMGVAGMGVAAVSLLSGCNDDDDDNGAPSPGSTATPSGTANGTATPNGTATATAQPTATARPGIDQRNFPGIIGQNINQVVFNFVLAHEYGEVDLYRQALNIASGLPIRTPLQVSRSYALRIPAGGLNEASGQAAADGFLFLRSQAFVELSHQEYLIALVRQLGGTPQPPNPGGYRFVGGPPSTLRGALSAILAVEENGQRGALGASPFLTTLELIAIGGQLLSIESRHQAALQHTLGLNPGPRRNPQDLLVTPNYPSPDTFEYYRTPPSAIAIDAPYKRPGTEAANITGPSGPNVGTSTGATGTGNA